MTLQGRIITTLGALIFLALSAWAAHHSGYTDGYAQRDLEYHAAEAALQREARATEARQTETLLGAVDEHTETTNRNQADAVATHAERDRVRDAFVQRARDLPTSSADACTVDRAAYGKLLEAVGQAIDQLTEDAERIALDADGHAADSLMYQRIGGIAPP
ncbi:hypothetical protein [Limnohabitans sp.]|uniref:hypothetical protein n=1 Tax=Limnohabitans sp. TaxID=1907725 RepID=UPI00286EB9E0|nr:hypothetical protein [Limnohabitans sp.]